MNSGNVSFLIYNKDVQALNDYYDMTNDTYFSCLTENYVYPCNVTTFINHKKQSGSSGLYRKYMYICITLCCTRQIESKLSFALDGKVFVENK